MCESPDRRAYGWRGWRTLPLATAPKPSGAWVDLSHPLSSAVPRVPFFPPPTFEQIYRMPKQQLNVTRMDMIVHMGTHMDAPRHFFLDGPALEDVPLERLAGCGTVCPVSLGEANLIEPSHLAGVDERLREGDILFLNTGWHQLVGTSRYTDDHPSLSLATADWILAKGIKMVGLDTPTPEVPVSRRLRGFDYPIHRRLLSNGVLIVEHLTNLGALDGQRVEILCPSLNVVGGDGAPGRTIARTID